MAMTDTDTPRPDPTTAPASQPKPALRRSQTLPDAPASKRASERPGPNGPDPESESNAPGGS
jgi:hypothetical protein